MSQNSQPKVAVVILNYNTRELLEKYLPSVLDTSYANTEIWVVDNASPDDSFEFVQRTYPQIKLLRSEENRGYAGGYNWALKQIEADFYVLLNSDVEVTPLWLDPLVKLANDESIGAIQPKILDLKQRNKFEYAGAAGGYLDKWGYAFCRGRIFDELEEDKGQYNDTKQVFWATGACLFVRADAYHKLNGLDDDFFAHMEEIDLCWRMQLHGYKVYVQPESEVYHLGGGTLSEGSTRKYFLNFRNNLIMLVKNDHSALWFFSLLGRMVLDGVSAIKFLTDGKAALLLVVLKAHFAFYKSLGSTLKKRRALKKVKTVRLVQRYPKSIVWQHFAKGVKQFSDLP